MHLVVVVVVVYLSIFLPIIATLAYASSTNALSKANSEATS